MILYKNESSIPYGIDEVAHILAHILEVMPQEAAIIARYALNLPQALICEEAKLFFLVFALK